MTETYYDMDVELPSLSLFEGVTGQDKAISLLRASARNPVHAYLLMGQSGNHQRKLWRGFAAALLCPDGGCGHCEWCSRCIRGNHPDLTEMESAGAALSVEEAHQLIRLAQRTPLVAKRQVLIVPDISDAHLAAPVLLKTLEEPPGKNIFVLTASTLPQEIVTIASRCLKIELASNQSRPIAAGGNGPSITHTRQKANRIGDMDEVEGAVVAGGSAQMVTETWSSVPSKLSATGSTIAGLVDEMLLAIDNALKDVEERQDKELKEFDKSTSDLGAPNPAMRKHLTERHHRELRKERVTYIRNGLLALSREYENKLAQLNSIDTHTGTDGGSVFSAATGHAAQSAMRSYIQAIETIHETSTQLVRNPNEKLLLQALLIKLADI